MLHLICKDLVTRRDILEKFTFENTTRVHFGEGQIAQLANEIPLDEKILVIYGGGSIKKNGVYNQVVDALKNHKWGEFFGVEPNPQYDTLMNAVAKIKEEGYQYLLAVGGGSVVDGVKFISVAACYNGDDPWDILLKGIQPTEALPLSCILTLPATGSETNIGAVVSRGESKLFFHSPLVRPEVAILDPLTTLSLSKKQITNGVIDAYVHVIEQYLTYDVNAKVQDRFSEGLMLTLLEEGPKALENPQDVDVRSNIMWAATWALNGMIGSGVPQDWTTHMIGHELTAAHGIDHGRTLSIILPAVMEVCRAEKEAKLLQYGERIFGITEGSVGERIDVAIEKTVEFFNQMETPTSLADVGLSEADIAPVVESLKQHGRLAMGERGDIDLAKSEAILKQAL